MVWWAQQGKLRVGQIEKVALTYTPRSDGLSAMLETWVPSLGREDPLGKEMATHCSTLAWKIPWKKEPGRLQSGGRKESDTTEQLYLLIHTIMC